MVIRMEVSKNVLFPRNIKCSGFHLCQMIKASKELVEGSNQNLGRHVHGQQSEALDVCEKDATERGDRKIVAHI